MKHILIVGAGIVGLSCARAALLAGYRVTVLERGPVPNPHAASYDSHRLIRYQYGSAVGYTRMVGQAFGAWDRLWADIGTCHFEATGALGISMEAGDYVTRSMETFHKLGIEHQCLSSEEIERLSPQLTLPENAWGLLNSQGGVLFADRIVESLVAWNRSHGADIRAHSRVMQIHAGNGVVELENGDVLEGDAVIVAAGAWLPDLLPEFGSLPSYRQAVCYVEPPDDDMRYWQTGPCLTDIGVGDNYALMPVRGTGLKFGSGSHRRSGQPSDGFAADINEGYEVIAPFSPYLKHASAYKPVRMAVGYYVKDGSERFQVKRRDKMFVVTNCDGQMFKFGPLIGERVIACFGGELSADQLERWATSDEAA
jgi:sarcosine oxidase